MTDDRFPMTPNPMDDAQVAALVESCGVNPARARCLLAVAAGVAPNQRAALAANEAGLLSARDVPTTRRSATSYAFRLTGEGRRLVARGLRDLAVTRAADFLAAAIDAGNSRPVDVAREVAAGSVLTLADLDTPGIARALEIARAKSEGPTGPGTAFDLGCKLYASRADAPRSFGRTWTELEDGSTWKGHDLSIGGGPQTFGAEYAARLAAKGYAFEVVVHVAGRRLVVATVRPWHDDGLVPEFADVAPDGLTWNTRDGAGSMFFAHNPPRWIAVYGQDAGPSKDGPFDTFDQAVAALVDWRAEAAQARDQVVAVVVTDTEAAAGDLADELRAAGLVVEVDGPSVTVTGRQPVAPLTVEPVGLVLEADDDFGLDDDDRAAALVASQDGAAAGVVDLVAQAVAATLEALGIRLDDVTIPTAVVPAGGKAWRLALRTDDAGSGFLDFRTIRELVGAICDRAGVRGDPVVADALDLAAAAAVVDNARGAIDRYGDDEDRLARRLVEAADRVDRRTNARPPAGWRWKEDGHNTIEADNPYRYVGVNDRGNVFVHGVAFRQSIQGRGATVVDPDTAQAIAFVSRIRD